MPRPNLDYTVLFEKAPTFTCVLRGPEHVFEVANEAYLRLIGRTDILGRPVREALPEVAEQGFFELLDRVYATGERHVARGSAIRFRPDPEGPEEERVLDFVYEPIRVADGSIEGILAQGHDVTEQARAQAALRASEERYRRIIEGADDFAIITLDEAGLITSWNTGAERLMGYTEAEALGRPGALFFTPEDRAKGDPDRELARALSEGRAVNERWHLRKDGSRFWGSGLVMRADGPGSGYIKVFRDRTVEHEGEARLRASEARLLALATASSEVLYRMSPDWGEMRELDGGDFLASTERPSRSWLLDYIPPEERARVTEAIDRAVAARGVFELEHRVQRQDGTVGWTLSRAVPVLGPDGEIEEWFGAASDVTARREAEEALRRSEERLRELNETLEARVAERTAERDRMWEASPDLLLVIDFEGRFWRVNPAWTAILGYAPEELVGHHVNEFVVPDDHGATVAAYETAAQGGQPRLVNRYRHKNGSLRWISWTAAPAGNLTYATGRDITAEKERQAELEQAQEALRQAQKMDAMGQLTGGVAHDFNNLLTPILAVLDRLERQGVGAERERRLIAGALQSAERARTLVQRLLAFARRQPLQPRPVDVGELVRGIAELVRSTTGPQIRVAVETAPDLPPALADANQVEMAILNLAVNARDAMPEGGTLRLSATAETVDTRHPSGAKPGRYVRLSVADTGVGMDQATLARAVEPFFSTKALGQGTGLGLSMAHGLAAQLGGTLTIQSRPALGTNVELWLPAAKEAERQAEADAAIDDGVMRSGTVLLVDDEDLVRASTAAMLTELGFRVREAGSGREALERVERDGRPNLVVTDHLMPGLTGTELIRLLRERHPGLPVLIISGYAGVEGIAPDLPRLVKPFRRAELATAVAGLAANEDNEAGDSPQATSS
ncbi:PAS domain S-box protein [Rubellimicrobium aerolatum]|uniref:histidine kinase n=1 Tax=Rubellimicrobium aerolatum TaxID=490979 RepID=A0ABW0SDR8_9RHOB